MIKPMNSTDAINTENAFKTFRAFAELRGIPVLHYWAGCFAEWMTLAEAMGIQVSELKIAFEEGMKMYKPAEEPITEQETGTDASN